MTPERWQHVKEIFHSALDREPSQRADFISNACGADEALRLEVESLIVSHGKDGSFIDSPVYEVAAELILNERSEFKPARRIGSYEILSFISRGGMGEVYLAQDAKLGRKVALKFLPGAFTEDQQRLRRFEQEARAVSALNHPNILTIHEIAEVDNQRFIASEYIDGETLRQRIITGPLTSPEALNIAEQIASALAAAHAEGIVHRDIKPENVMLRRDGIVKVLDFGLAKLTERPSLAQGSEAATLRVKTVSGVIMGTTGYMSPEQARGMAVDARCDIFSLGAVIYEMVACRKPFSGETASDVLAEILKTEPPSLSRIANAPPELDRIVTKALRKDREERYQTMTDLRLDLKTLKEELSFQARLNQSLGPNQDTELSGQSVAGDRASPPAQETKGASPTIGEPVVAPSRSKSKRRLVWATLLVAMVALASAIVWKGRAYFNHPTQTPVVVLMDSPLPDRVYDPETRKNGGTNADDITDILRDLPIVIEKENTSTLWHREDQVLNERPSLIVIHRSCFADATLGFDPQSTAKQVADKKVESFLGYISLGNPTTKFLTYTRRTDDQGAWLLDLEKRFPQLKGRVVALTVPGGAEHASFRDPDTAKMIKQQVQSILGLH